MMYSTVVHDEDEFAWACTKARCAGYRLAAVSNTGLPPGQRRLTFLPSFRFDDTKKGPATKSRTPVRSDVPQHDVRDWLKDFES